MRKIIVFLILLFAALLGVRWHLGSRLAGDDVSQRGVDLAIAKLTADRKTLSLRTAAIAEVAHRSGKSTVDEVAELMADEDLNRLALLYMGADWSIPRGAFLGSVRQIRELQRMQELDRVRRVKELRDRLGQFERRRRIIDTRLDAKSDLHNRAQEKAEIDRQLLELRASQTYREFVETDALSVKNADAKAMVEKTIAKIAEEYRAASVVRLDAVLAESLTEQRAAAEALDRLKRVFSWTDFWPLNVLVPSRSIR